MSEGTRNTKKYVSRLLKDMEYEQPETIYEGQQEDEYSRAPVNSDLPMNRLVISILGITALSNSAYAIIAPFLPFEFEKKGVDPSWLGYIFSIYSVAVVLCSPMVGKLISILGRRNLVQFGMLLMGTSFIIFGQLDKLESKEAFLTLALMNRFL
jgi:MFS family permease